jgi:hypothetical protein
MIMNDDEDMYKIKLYATEFDVTTLDKMLSWL